MPAARDEDWGAIAAQASAGATLTELAEHWNIPVGTLKDRCAREGWKRIAREVQEQKTGIAVCPQHPIQPRPTDRAISLRSTLGERSRLRAARVGDRTLIAIGKKKDDALIALAQPFATTVTALSKVHGWSDQPHSTQVNVQVVNNQVIPDA